MAAKGTATSLRDALAGAVAHERAGRPAEAERLYRQVLRRRPDQADALHGMGILAYRAGKLRPAAEYLRRAVAHAPSAPPFHSHLGVVLRALGRHEEAVAAHRRALELDPTAAPAHNNFGNALRDRGDFEEAETHFREAIRLQPDYAEAHANLANTLADQGRVGEAEQQFLEALRLRPEYAEAHNDLGNLYRGQEKHEQAMPCYRRAIEAKPAFAAAYVNLAGALQKLARLDEAPALFRRALELDPTLPEAHLGVGGELLQEGKIEEAVAFHRKALSLNPNLSGPYMTLASIPSVTLQDAEIEHMDRMLEKDDLNEGDRSNLLFALAKAYESKKDYDKAFALARAANEIDRKKIDFSAAGNANFIDRTIATFTPAFFRERRGFGSPSELPIFVVGLPRSGTTLIEQIIASHPKAHGAGELTELHELSKTLPSLLQTTQPYPEYLAEITRDRAADLAERHLEFLKKKDPTAARVTDKLPFNFRHLGMIALLFPGARVIHSRRDPRDVAVSCYFLKFLKPISFAYDLTEFGQYYRDYERLMAHWRRALPLPMLEVDYEELVAEQEVKIREIIDFCGLEWDDRCLAAHQAERAVRTASAWQVRQPIYKGSAGRWRRYERFLGPLFEALGDSLPEK
jgi:tetratricopeptide (TPR) repeat protein